VSDNQAPPTPPGVDPDTIDAVGDDLEDVIAALEGVMHNVENLRSRLLGAAAEARAGRGTP
jgi:hypothetical protein